MAPCRAGTDMTHSPPPAGAWLRPVGLSYGYCLKVLRVHESASSRSPLEVLECERWGRDAAGLPLRDGHQNAVWNCCLRKVAPGVWRDTSSCAWSGPRYYRLMPDTGPSGQRDLFA